MKLWKKVYVFALIIITLCVNLGFLGIVAITYHYMLQAECERCETEYRILKKSILEDVERLELAIPFNNDFFARYIYIYNNYYETDTKLLGVVDDKIITEDEENWDNLPQTDGVFIYEETATTVYISQSFSEKYPNYRIVMQRTLDDFDKMWERLLPFYFLGSILLSLGVSGLLAIVVRMLLKPLDELESVSKKVQAGDWSARVSIKGKDELVQLGNQFNAMASAIQDNMEALKRQAEQKQELVQNVSHEMNTPITSIQGFAEYMKLTEISKEEQQECLDFILGESCRLKEISSTLLTMAEIENGDEIPREMFSLKELCTKLEALYRKQFAQENIRWEVSCEEVEMYGNLMLMESLLRNLITNALRAVLGKEEKWIELKVFSKEAEFQIWVTDNGCGMEEVHRTQIFEPFYRVDKARSRMHGGSGLGLTFCKKVVELHHGVIDVKSKWGKGTRFTIIFKI